MDNGVPTELKGNSLTVGGKLLQREGTYAEQHARPRIEVRERGTSKSPQAVVWESTGTTFLYRSWAS